MDAQCIKNTCLEIRMSSLKQTNKRAYFESQNAKFVEDYPKLFEACLNDDFPLLQNLDYMLEMMTVLNSEKISVEDADKEVYGKLSDQYVVPVLEKENGNDLQVTETTLKS